MGDTDSYDKIEEWLNQNGMTPEFVPTACAELLEEIILDIITPTAEGESDVSLPAAATLIEAEHDVSQSDMELLIQLQSDYDKIIKSCISENYANVWISGNISKTIHSLYTGKWETLSGNFQNLTLRSAIIGTLGLLQQLCDILDLNINPETYAICKADMLLKGDGNQAEHISYGSTLSLDGNPSRQFDFMLSNPPYGKSWKTDAEKMEVSDS